MNNEKNSLSGFNFTTLWFGAAVSIAEIMTGGLLSPLGFKKGFLIIIIGHLIGTSILILGGIIGYNEKIPSIMSTRISFGRYGSFLFSALNILQLIGWTAVMIISGSRSLNLISQALWGYSNIYLYSIIIGSLIFIWILFGNKGLKRLNSVAVYSLLALTLVLSFIIFKEGTLFTKVVLGEMSIGLALELNIIMPLSWLPLIADYTRFAKTKKGSIIGSFIGYFIGSSFMYTIGLASSIVFNTTEVGTIMLSANLGIIALFIILLSTVTTTFLDANSAGVSLNNVFPKFDEKQAALIMTIIGVLIALIIPIEEYENFLYAIGSVFAPLFAVLFTDYFIIREKRNEENIAINFYSFFTWILGVFLYYKLLKFDLIFGTTVPVMILTGIFYLIIRRISTWALKK